MRKQTSSHQFKVDVTGDQYPSPAGGYAIEGSQERYVFDIVSVWKWKRERVIGAHKRIVLIAAIQRSKRARGACLPKGWLAGAER